MRVDERVERVDVGPHRGGGIDRLLARVGDDEGDRLADEAHAVGGERRAYEVGVNRHEAVVRGDAERVGREHGRDTVHVGGLVDVDRAELAVRGVGAGEHGGERPGDREVVDEPVRTTQQRRDPRCAARGVPRIDPRRSGCHSPTFAHGSSHYVHRVLRIVLPKGSLERATFELFEAADLHVSRSSSVDYKATIDDPRVADVRILRPQEIPVYVAEGLFDIGITGRDWIEETSSDVVSLGELRYSKATSEPIKLVVAVAGDSSVQSVKELPRRRARLVGVSRAHPAVLRRAGHRRPTCGSATARARPRCPTSPTAWSRSPRPGERCARPGCGSSTPCS